MLELREEIARYLNSRYGLVYDPQNEILITVGVSEGLDLAMRAILDPGDEVIGHEPVYVSYKPCTMLAGGKFIPVPTAVENEFQVNADDIEKRVTSRTKALMLGYPSNPTGAVMDRAGLSKIAEVAQRHDLIVVSDEVYERLVYGVEHTCFASLPGMQERTIHLGGFSKAYAMTGWRLGFAAAREEIIQMAALEALREGDAQVEEMVAEYDRRRRVIVDGLNHIGLTCFEPRGAFYAFPSIKSTGLSSEDFAERLLLEEHVAVVPGNVFGECGEGHIRCCYATSMEEIEEALERMGRFVKRHRLKEAKR
jgi:aminotransferase